MIRHALLASLCLTWTAVAQAAPVVVWQIGKIDRNYQELGNAGNVFGGYPQAFPKDVHFEVASSAASDLSASHPGPVDQWAGGRTHPFRINFKLPGAAAALYELQIDIVDTQSQFAPVLRVRVNDQSADTALETGVGDYVVMHPEKGKHRSLRFTVPGDLLKSTGNQIELTVTSGSWILYDAITLQEVPEAHEVKAQLRVQPTIFLVEKDGRLEQECTLTAQRLLSSQPVLIEVRSGDQVLARSEAGKPQLGALTTRLTLPASDTPRELTFTCESGAQTTQVRVEQQPVRKWHIYVAPSTHTDIGYTDVQDRVIELHNRNTDLAIELAQEFPLYHWNLESSWAAQMWLRDNPWTRRQLIDAARNRRIGIEAGYLNMLTGLCSHEELIRNMYYTANLARIHGVPFESLTLTDAPSHVWSVPSVLAGAGIKYLSCGVNQTRAPLFRKGINQKAPFWWEGPDGGRVLTWLSDGYSQAELIGLKWGVDRMREVIEGYMAGWNKRGDYPYDAILLHGAYSDNVAIGRDIAETITAYAKRYAYPRVTLAGNKDFFEYIEKQFADRIPTVRGCGGSWWEDGAASTAFETAVNRRNHKQIATAEAAWAVLGALDSSVQVPLRRIGRVWDNILLYDEHTWGAHNSITQPTSDFVTRQWAIKADYARVAETESRRLLDEALHDLAQRAAGLSRNTGNDATPSPRDTTDSATRSPGQPVSETRVQHGPSAARAEARGSLLVFNPFGRARSGVVEATIPRGCTVVDGDRAIPQQIVGEHALKQVTIALYAKDVPPLGYRLYGLSETAQAPAPPDAAPQAPRIENTWYAVTFDEKTGGVRSILDKRRNRELVDASSPYTLGQVIYAHGGDQAGKTQVMCPDPAGVKLHLSGEARLGVGRHGSVMTSLRSVSRVRNIPRIETEVILYANQPRLDVMVTLLKEMTFDKEAVYVAFPIAGRDPQFRYEIGGGSVRPNADHWPGGCRDWLSLQRWLTVHTADGAVAWSAPDTPLVQLCAPQAGKWLEELPITNGTILAYVMNNYWFTNYKAGQDGRFTFRYSLTSAESIDPAAATRFGEDVQHPLVAAPAGEGGVPAENQSGSFLSVEPANVELSYVKPAEDGRGVIIRIHETAGQACKAALNVRLPGITAATSCDLVERDGDRLDLVEGQLLVPLKASATRTIRLHR